MRLIVTDANIFIDVNAGGVLEEMFRLQDVEFVVPDILYIEELSKQHPRLPGLGLKILSLSGAAVGDAQALRRKYRKPSQNDLFALALAREQKSPLLSGDGRLREAADAEGVEVHGTLWLIEKMIVEKAITVARAEEAYEKMREDGSRLPWTEVQKQLRRLREQA